MKTISRSYFMLLGFLILGSIATQANDISTTEHERLIPFQGTMNFRDLGGYQSENGQSVKWGKIFRSDALVHMTASDLESFEKLGVASVCDFRSADELAREPDPESITSSESVHYLTLDIMGMVAEKTGDHSNWVEQFKSANVNPDEMMNKGYIANAFLASAGYKKMFEQLLANENGATLYHCTAGKDRTGVASALVLMALGVPKKTIVEDYMLSLQYYKMPDEMIEGASKMYGIPAELMREFSKVKPEWIEAVLTEIETKTGGFENYFTKVLGLSDADLAKLKEMYLE